MLCLMFTEMSLARGNEETISQQNRINLELQYKIEKLQKENLTLSRALEEKTKEGAILESMLSAEARDFRRPELVKPDEGNLDKAIHLNLGFAHGVKGELKEAIEEYQRALQHDPGDKDIHYNLGYLLGKQKRYKEAIQEYKKALKGLPQDREAYYNLAVIYATGLKNQKTAQEYHNLFLRLSSTDTGPSPQIEEPSQKN